MVSRRTGAWPWTAGVVGFLRPAQPSITTTASASMGAYFSSGFNHSAYLCAPSSVHLHVDKVEKPDYSLRESQGAFAQPSRVESLRSPDTPETVS